MINKCRAQLMGNMGFKINIFSIDKMKKIINSNDSIMFRFFFGKKPVISNSFIGQKMGMHSHTS